MDAQDNTIEDVNSQDKEQYQLATFAAGCFWGVEAAFAKINGVVSTRVGYTGGKTVNPTYKQVCSGKTGHAEAMEIIFDPKKISYERLLDMFWELHDPTQLNRQGPDFGEQYRSAVFYHNLAQQAAAESSRQRLEESGKYKQPIVTQIVRAQTFYPAEEYHQKYLEKRGLSVCH
ncbi:MAG: peptide-methionine (S)-S-oxide reductase MsrA [Phycisphaerae bacterium]